MGCLCLQSKDGGGGSQKPNGMSEFVGPDSSLGFGWRALALHFELLHLLDNVVDGCRPCGVALIVTPWHCAVGHEAGECPLGSFQGMRPTVGRTVASSNVAIRITKSAKGHGPLDVIRPDVKKIAPSEGSSPTRTVKFNGEGALKFCEATQTGVALLLVWQGPSDSIVVIVELMLGMLFEEKRIVKKEFGWKKNWTKQTNQQSMPAQTEPHKDNSKRRVDGRFCSPWWEAINSKLQMFCRKRKQFLHGFQTKSK